MLLTTLISCSTFYAIYNAVALRKPPQNPYCVKRKSSRKRVCVKSKNLAESFSRNFTGRNDGLNDRKFQEPELPNNFSSRKGVVAQ
jgi:hypothetical protein